MTPDQQATPPVADPGLRARFGAGLASDPLGPDLLARWDRWGPDLLEGLAGVYPQPGVGDRIVDLIVAGHRARGAVLRDRDRGRLLAQDWFQRPDAVGYACYADRFAGTLDGVARRVDYLRELGVTYLHLMDAKRVVGLVFAAVGVSIPIVLAITGSRDEPPSASVQGLLAFVAVVAQVAAGWLFSSVGVVDPSHPRRAVRRLEGLRRRAAEARLVADRLVDMPDMKVADRRVALGELSVWMSVVQEEVVEAMEDWYEAMPHAIEAAAAEAEGIEDGD